MTSAPCARPNLAFGGLIRRSIIVLMALLAGLTIAASLFGIWRADLKRGEDENVVTTDPVPPSAIDLAAIDNELAGYAAETLVVVARSNPSDETLAKYIPLMRQYRSTLVDDLARADLPQDFIDAVGRIDQDAESVKQLQSVINACLI
jgi:hypothetical protein